MSDDQPRIDGRRKPAEDRRHDGVRVRLSAAEAAALDTVRLPGESRSDAVARAVAMVREWDTAADEPLPW